MSEHSLIAGAAGGDVPAPLSPRGLLELFLRPRRFFARTGELRGGTQVTLAAWLIGIAGLIERFDLDLTKAAVGVNNRLASYAMDSWLAFWGVALAGGVIYATVVFHVGGWWYGVRLRWCGAADAEPELARGVFAFQNVVEDLPVVAVTLAYTFVFSDYAEAWRAETGAGGVLFLFLAWSCVTSYAGATTAFKVSRLRAAIWFGVLPLLAKTLGMAAVGLFIAYGLR